MTFELPKTEKPAQVRVVSKFPINGEAPIWLYAYLVHQLHPVAWVAINDPRLGGGVVVTTHLFLNGQVKIGQVIPF